MSKLVDNVFDGKKLNFIFFNFPIFGYCLECPHQNATDLTRSVLELVFAVIVFRLPNFVNTITQECTTTNAFAFSRHAGLGQGKDLRPTLDLI